MTRTRTRLPTDREVARVAGLMFATGIAAIAWAVARWWRLPDTPRIDLDHLDRTTP